MPNWAKAPFVPGERSHFQVVGAASDSLPDTDSALPVICSSFQFDFMVLPNFMLLPRCGAVAAVASFSRRKRKTSAKKTAAEKNPRRGVVAGRGKRGSPSTRPTDEIFSPNGRGCRCALRLWNPEIIDRSHLTSPVEVSKTGQHSARRVPSPTGAAYFFG